MMMNVFYALTLLFFASPAFAGQVYISIGDAKIKKSVLAIPKVKITEASKEAEKAAETLHQILNRDLEFTALFRIQDPQAFIEPPAAGLALDGFKLSDWSTIGTEFLLKTGVQIEDGQIALELRLHDVLGGKQIHGKRYMAPKGEATTLAHTAANDIMEALTGHRGMFLSKLAFVCNRSGQKEIYVSDYDGSNVEQLTHHRSLAFAPAWSPDAKLLAYSVYTKNSKNVKNIDLYEYNFQTKKSTLLSNRPGTNSGASYHPEGDRVALTMSFLGNQEVFALDRRSKKVTKLTNSFGFDVDPSYSPSGNKVAFVSSRSGLPMVYTMNTDGSSVQRLTFAGKFNATPTWSPDGKKIAFAGWIDKHFDVFMMNTDGSGLERLTKNEGSNEDTFFSPDGNFIAFTSNRAGQKNVYAITTDGQTTRRLTFGLGHCETPKWSLGK